VLAQAGLGGFYKTLRVHSTWRFNRQVDGVAIKIARLSGDCSGASHLYMSMLVWWESRVDLETKEGSVMASGGSNIIQAEFFHVGGDDVTLKEVLRECAERAADGHELSAVLGRETQFGIKTVVRFFDEDGSITEIVQQIEQTKQRRKDLFETFSRAPSPWQTRRLNSQLQKLAGEIDELKKEVRQLVMHKVNYVARTPGNAALELADHSFRLIRDDERHELCEAVCGAVDFWIFVFEPNELLADKNELITSVM